MKYISLSALAMAFIFLTSCQGKKNDSKIAKITLEKKVSTLSDSSFISDIRNIVWYKGKYFLGDYSRGQIITLDSTLNNVVFTYGQSGEGPGEFKGLPEFSIYMDTIYAANDAKKTIEVFSINNAKPIKTISFPNEIVGTSFSTRFYVGQYIYCGLFDFEHPITVFDKNGKSRRKIGKAIYFDNAKQRSIRNNRFVLSDNESRIISISDNMPQIDVYEKNGKKLFSADISDVDVIQERLRFAAQHKLEDERSYYNMVADAYINDGKLYLLCYSGKEKPQKNKIAVFGINKKNITYLSTLELPGSRWYSSFCVNDSNILAYNSSTDELELYTNGL